MINETAKNLHHRPLDTKNIVAKILDSRHRVYQIGTKSEIIKNWFSRYDLRDKNLKCVHVSQQKICVIQIDVLAFKKRFFSSQSTILV